MFSTLGLYPSGVDRKQLDVDDPDVPNALADFCIEMETIATGGSVVPGQIEPALGAASSSIPDGDYRLTLDEVMQFVGDAKDCHDMEQEEAGKRVDYVFNLDPSKDGDQSTAKDEALNLRRTLTDNSINHTSYPPLRAHPLSVSIETKRSGESEQKAQLQMGVWQAAQWKLLSALAGDDLRQLPFIPGIFIHGHEWKFVATSYRDGKTTLWTGGTFGSTETPLKTFQAIAGVRRLRAWSLEVFWPWYKTYVLKIPTTFISVPNVEPNI
ncbi:hypothetical protein Neosp_015204 [[Neocosmospora] mangrovei]